jgi:GYF domain 2
MKETNWYVVRKGRKMGPMSRSQLDQLYNSDNLQPNDDLWSPDVGEWTKASKLYPFTPAPSAVEQLISTTDSRPDTLRAAEKVPSEGEHQETTALHLVLAWGFVGIPLVFGVVQTLINSMKLFQ